MKALVEEGAADVVGSDVFLEGGSCKACKEEHSEALSRGPDTDSSQFTKAQLVVLDVRRENFVSMECRISVRSAASKFGVLQEPTNVDCHYL